MNPDSQVRRFSSISSFFSHGLLHGYLIHRTFCLYYSGSPSGRCTKEINAQIITRIPNPHIYHEKYEELAKSTNIHMLYSASVF